MDASTLVDELLASEELTALLATDPYGNPAIYQILSPEAEVFPRLAVFESDREYTRFADDQPLEEEITFRIDIYARENLLYPINAALHNAMRRVSYDASSTVLTVQFTSNLHGGTVDVYRDGAKVAGITANSGTTFSCVLREYGEGNYSVIVSNGNTVIDSKNFTVR